MANCPFCGIEVQAGLKFCTNCGASLEGVELIGDQPAPVQPPIEVPAEPVVSEQPYQPPQEAAQQAYQQPGAQQAYQQQPGAQQAYQQPYQQPQPAQFAPAQAAPVDSGSIGWAILGFIIPIVGIILFFVWKDTKPQSGKMALIGALVSIVLGIIFQFFNH